MNDLWRPLSDLPLRVESYRLEALELITQSGYRRLTTEICLEGGGFTGRGEEVAWGAELQEAFRARGGYLPLAGRFTLGTFSALLEQQELSPDPPPIKDWLHYRRWAFESAALDLALRQNRLNIASALQRKVHPLRFCTSLGLHDFGEIEKRFAIHPDMEFKLDATPDWSVELCEQLAQTGAVNVVDFKGAYVGTPVDVASDLGLYKRVLDAMPEVIIEDPHDTPEVRDLLLARDARIAWDAPIHHVSDLERMPLRSSAINIKPSRFGSLEHLLEAYEFAGRHKLMVYGGGQFELGVGRRQNQLLAALFHADGPNDVAPRGYHMLESKEPRPASPLRLDVAPTGFDLLT